MSPGGTDTDWRVALAALPTSRTCEGCDVCCSVMAIRELEKPPGQPCRHAAGGGCGIWGAHPASCKTFTCLWRRSDQILPPEMFPARCGFLLALDPTATWPTVVKVAAHLDAREPWDTPAHRALFARLAKAWNCAVVVMESDGRGRMAFTPRGGLYSREAHPAVFPHDGWALTAPDEDFDPDRRPPPERIAAAAFRWDAEPGAPATDHANPPGPGGFGRADL